MSELEILVITRSLERLMVCFFGGLSLILGWHLFRVGVVDPQAAELENKHIKFKLQKVGPGAFFAIFGTSILIYTIIYGLNYTPAQTIQTTEQSTAANNFSETTEENQQNRGTIPAVSDTAKNKVIKPLAKNIHIPLKSKTSSAPKTLTVPPIIHYSSSSSMTPSVRYYGQRIDLDEVKEYTKAINTILAEQDHTIEPDNSGKVLSAKGGLIKLKNFLIIEVVGQKYFSLYEEYIANNKNITFSKSEKQIIDAIDDLENSTL